MRKISTFLQEILKILTIFLFYFVWLRYFVRKLAITLTTTVILTIITYAILYYIRRKKQNISGLKQKEIEDAQNMFLSLSCGENQMDFFEKLAKTRHKNITKHKKYLTITYPEENAKTFLWFCGDFDGLDTTKMVEIIKIAKREKPTKVVVLCKFVADKNLQNFLGNFKTKFVILDEFQTYQKLYKLYDFYPKITQKYSSEKKMLFKDMVAYSFNKKRTKGYLFSALILIFSSLFVPMTIYYCVVSTILLIFAIISQFNPYFNNKNVGEVL